MHPVIETYGITAEKILTAFRHKGFNVEKQQVEAFLPLLDGNKIIEATLRCNMAAAIDPAIYKNICEQYRDHIKAKKIEECTLRYAQIILGEYMILSKHELALQINKALSHLQLGDLKAAILFAMETLIANRALLAVNVANADSRRIMIVLPDTTITGLTKS